MFESFAQYHIFIHFPKINQLHVCGQVQSPLLLNDYKVLAAQVVVYVKELLQL